MTSRAERMSERVTSGYHANITMKADRVIDNTLLNSHQHLQPLVKYVRHGLRYRINLYRRAQEDRQQTTAPLDGVLK